MTNKEIYKQIEDSLKKLKIEAPRNEERSKLLKYPNAPVTGNLKHNAIKLDYLGNGVYRLYVDENIAPYMPYTNEPWISPKWKGTPNPNEYWFENAESKIAHKIAKSLKGKLKKIKE